MNKISVAFPDWFSPMLVKELRQNLHSPWLIGFFLLAQGLLLLLTLMAGVAVQSGWIFWSNWVDTLFFLLCSILFIAAIPFQISGSLAFEIRNHTLELVLMTRMAASGLVWGKWISAVIRAAIFGSTIIPYIILRHFLGAYNMLRGLEMLGLIFLACMVLTALAVSLSVYRSVFLRAVELGMLLISCLVIFALTRAEDAFPTRDGLFFSGLLMTLVNSALLICVLLESGATQIAPFAENHSLSKRLAALVALGLAPVFSHLGIPAPSAYGVASVVVLWALLDGLSEPMSPVARSVGRLWRYGVPGRLLALVFSPGWASASVFTLLILGISFEALHVARVSKEPMMALIFASLFAAVVWPASLIRFSFSRMRNFYVFYFLFQFIGSVLAFSIYEIPSKTNGFWDVLVCLLSPSTVFFLAVTEKMPPTGLDIYLWVSTTICCLSVLLLLVRVLLDFIGWQKKML